MVFSAHICLVEALQISRLPHKSGGQVIWMILLILLGINAWIEGIVIALAISLNLTVQELKSPGSFGYLRPLQGPEEDDDEEDIRERYLVLLHCVTWAFAWKCGITT